MPIRLFPDTSPEAETVLIERIRSLSGVQRLAVQAQLNAQMRAVALAGIRLRHPFADPAELHRRLAEVLLGSELATQAYGPIEVATGTYQAEETDQS